MNTLKDTVLLAICGVLFSFLFAKCFIMMAEQGANDSSRYAKQHDEYWANAEKEQIYIAPADEVAIELMKGANHE